MELKQLVGWTGTNPKRAAKGGGNKAGTKGGPPKGKGAPPKGKQ